MPDTPRIIAGRLRGRHLAVPPGPHTRPTAIRLRQAIFDILAHAPWAGGALLEGAAVLDGFAGSGALGLEALSRGATTVTFIEQDRAALAALRRNIESCAAQTETRIIAADMTRPPPGPPQDVIFLDPPYGKDLLPPSLRGLRQAGWLAPGTLVVAEFGRLDPAPDSGAILAQRVHGAGQMIAWREN